MRTLAATLAALVLLLGAGSASASAATLSGRISGLPPRAEIAFATVRAVSLGSGRIMAVDHVRAGARYRFTVPPGRYVLVLGAMRSDGRLLRVVSQRMTAGSRPSTGRGRVVRASLGAAGAVVTMGEVDIVPVAGAALPPARLGDLALSRVFGPLSARGVRFVDQSPRVVAAALREQRLSLEGRSDTPVRYRPLKPRFEIAGGGVVDADGMVDLGLELRDLATGQVVARRTVRAGRAGLARAITNLTSEFAEAAGGAIDRAPPTPAAAGVLVDLAVTLTSVARGGRVTASPPGRSFIENDATPTSYEFRAADGTAIALTAAPDAGFFFEGWTAESRCGMTPITSEEAAITCTVVDPVPGPGDEPFGIVAGASFRRCPPPGTLVVNSPNAAVCPGVKVFAPPPA